MLRKHDQYATAKAVEEAFGALICLGQYKWERDIAISQLEELGISFGQKVDYVKELIDKNKAENVKYKDSMFVCPACEKSTFSLALYGGDYCQHCGQHVKWRGVIKQ